MMEVKEKSVRPIKCNRLRPHISAALAMGSIKITLPHKGILANQLKRTASAFKSNAIDGSAKLTADIAIGVIKAARHKLNSAIQFAAGVVLLVAVLMLIDCLSTDIGILDEHFIVGG